MREPIPSMKTISSTEETIHSIYFKLRAWTKLI